MTAVLCEQREQVLWLTIDRPAQRNAINDEVLAGLRAGLERATGDAALRAVVLTGAGDKAFCAGADLQQASAGAVFDAAGESHPMIELFHAAERCNKPLIARVNGHCMAGGLGLLCLCDLAIAVEGAKFGTPEVRVGVFPMMILSYLQRLVPRRRLLELCLTAEPISAAEALDYGLLNRVVPATELDGALENLLAKLLAGSPAALQLGKKAFRAMQDMSLAECFEYSQLMIARLGSGADAQEGVRAFLEKRAPNWTSAKDM